MKPLRLYLVLLVGTVVVAWLVMQLAPIDAAGSFAYQTGAFGTASTLFLESAVRDPGDPFRVYSAGSAQLGLDDSEAADLLLRSYELGDEDLKQLSAYNAGIAYFREADYFAAVRAFRAVLEIDPSDSDARYNYELALRYALPPTHLSSSSGQTLRRDRRTRRSHHRQSQGASMGRPRPRHERSLSLILLRRQWAERVTLVTTPTRRLFRWRAVLSHSNKRYDC